MPATFVRRAVSPLRFETIQSDPDDILCPGSDVEETLEEHRAKRRRVEEAGTQYLRGKSLYMASARLKGPFTGYSNAIITASKTHEARYVKASRGQQRSTEHYGPEAPIYISTDEPKAQASTSFERVHRLRPVERVEVAANTANIRPKAGEDRRGTQDSFVTAATGTSKQAERNEQAEDCVSPPHIWLKTSEAFLIKPPRSSRRMMSPTPTPKPRQQRQSPERMFRGVSQEDNIRRESESRSFASATKWITPARLGTARGPSPSDLQPHCKVKEIELGSLDVITKEAHQTVKKLAREAAEQAQYDWGVHLKANQLSELAVSQAQEGSDAIDDEPVAQYEPPDAAVGIAKTYAQDSKRPARTIPPSTHLPEFEYRSRRTSKSPERKSFKEDLEAAKKKARAEQNWRLSFTASGSVRSRSPRTSHGSRTTRPTQSGSSHQTPHQKPAEQSPLQTKKFPAEPRAKDGEGTTSGQLEGLPEAQIRQEPALIKVPSGPSTELLETDKQPLKFPSTDEGDSYLGLSTQGALLKAQRSFHDNIISPNSDGDSSVSQPSKRAHIQHMLSKDRRQAAASLKPRPATPAAHKEEPMSTQAMIDALSPFADNTVKKRRSIDSRPDLTPSISRSSSPVSPTLPDFRTKSLSMSTSPSPPPAPANEPTISLSALSKPASSLASFSVAPNGTMTEIFQQDGQQQQDYVVGDLDLDAAIEDAGSFLGDWNVEKEARNLERSTAESRASTSKGSRLLSSH